jgi:endonuclease-3
MTAGSSKIKTILQTLSARYPVVKTQLEHGTPFQLLIATILSAQCTDSQVNKVSKNLFYAYPDPEALARAPLGQIKKIIYSTGFYNNKAKNIKACALALVNEYGGVVPEDMERLVTLPGVGRKTANVVLSAAFGQDTIVVDTHVMRISNRLGLTDKTDPVKIEYELMAIIPRKAWNAFSLQLIYFGREICDAKKPLCLECPLFKICPFGKKRESNLLINL